MPKKINLLGQRFGKLTVIAPAENKNKKTRWLCHCDCGQDKICFTDSLQSGRCNSCGCLRTQTAQNNGRRVLKDLTGQKFGKLTVIKYAGSKRQHSQWLCQCDCGNTKIVNQMELKRGDTLSCGCLQNSYAVQEIIKILTINNISFQTEYSFSDLVSEHNIPLRFDFAIFNQDKKLQCLIEYDGEQHFSNKTDLIWADNLKKRQERDLQKNNYCKEHNLLLYRIPYWEKNHLSLDLLFDNKYLIS